ncbi:hypothetical protein NQZ68_022180, partial [Dissostichus eleginoides]
MNPKAWMLCIDQVVVTGPHDHFVQGIAALFASYYGFNLQYPEHGSSTLECFLGINPETGSKPKKRHGNLNPHVSTFFRKLVDFEW